MDYVKNINFKFKILIFCLFFFFNNIALSNEITFNGLSKLNINDIQSITDIDIFDKNLSISDVNEIIKDLYTSELIYDVELNELSKPFILNIIESNLISNVFVNGNTWIKDELILENLSSKKDKLISKKNILLDINLIKQIYSSKGFSNSSVSVKTEKYSSNKVNLIFEIFEGNQSKISYIDFKGNLFFSDKFLNSIIESNEINFYNFFKSGSNLNFEIFEFDRNKILNKYKDYGFFDAKIVTTIEKLSLNSNKLTFFIDEGKRAKIKEINFDYKKFSNELFINERNYEIRELLKKNDFLYDFSIIDEYLNNLNDFLLSNNMGNYLFEFELIRENVDFILNFYEYVSDPVIVNKIDLEGNSITKNSTIRSKIDISPGDYINRKKIERINKNLLSYPYIDNSKYIIKQNSSNNADIVFQIDENVKTGNLLLAGTLNNDTGFGINFGVEDKNIFGSGNSLKGNFNFDSENINFNINYIQFPLFNSNITNSYSIFNDEKDLLGSFGFKTSNVGLGYNINYKIDKNSSFGSGFTLENIRGHSAKNTDSIAITDNIGDFNNLVFKINYTYDSTNDLFAPTNGHKNSIFLTLSPDKISDNSFYKFTFSNKNYFNFNNSNNFLFLLNNYGLADAFDSRLKSINSFSLGGLNFKGFDYRGIGPKSGNIYLGGNQYFTSTIGYGGSFLFDEKDNVNIKVFSTIGSLWDSDYSNNNNFDLRTSIGTSLDFLTPVGPISFSYAVPLIKDNSDIQRNFSFSIGTSF